MLTGLTKCKVRALSEVKPAIRIIGILNPKTQAPKQLSFAEPDIPSL